MENKKIMIVNGNHFVLAYTNATKTALDEWCIHYNYERAMNRTGMLSFDTIRKQYHFSILLRSPENTRKEAEEMDYDDYYDLNDYAEYVIWPFSKVKTFGQIRTMLKHHSLEEMLLSWNIAPKVECFENTAFADDSFYDWLQIIKAKGIDVTESESSIVFRDVDGSFYAVKRSKIQNRFDYELPEEEIVTFSGIEQRKKAIA